ncbi:MAG: HAD-IIIA family hydrolase [Lachnospiraceae bacterium]|nr:HAD-IIIA family hydrolase [Lachnospiraceae bacterium]
MTKPKMILFDYGQTLVNEAKFDGVKGTEAVLQYATKNKYNRTAAEIQAVADEMNGELGRFDPARRHLIQVEIPNDMFCGYLYESQGVELSIKGAKRDKVFWDAASPGVPTIGVEDFLSFLKEQGIRTAVLSNITYCGEALKNRLQEVLPNHEFEFILATSEYMYRKPHRRIFEFALDKAELEPEEVWYIGDNYECDIEGARNAGLFPVWYLGATEKPQEPKEGLITVKSWEEVKALLL